jgi:hypothetical protein
MSNSEVFGAIREMIVGQINEANEIADEVKKSRVDVNKLTHEMRDDVSTEDEVIKAYQAKVAKLDATREKLVNDVTEHIKANLPKSEMTDEVYTVKSAKYAELRKAIKSTEKLAANIPGYSADVIKDIPVLKTLTGATAGAGTGTKRPRLSFLSMDGDEIFVMKDGKDENGNKTEVKSYTFTLAAERINKAIKGAGVKPSDLSAAAFSAAGSEDLSNGVEFNYSVTANGTTKDYAFKVSQAASVEDDANTDDANETVAAE